MLLLDVNVLKLNPNFLPMAPLMISLVLQKNLIVRVDR